MTGSAGSELLKIYESSYCLMKHPHRIALVSKKPAPFQTQNLYSCVCCCHFYVQGFFFFFFAEHWRSWTEGTGIPPPYIRNVFSNVKHGVFPRWSSESCRYCKKYCHFEDIQDKMQMTLPIAATQIVTSRYTRLYWQWFSWPRQGRRIQLGQLLQELFFEHWQWAVTSRFSQMAQMGSAADLAVQLHP